jgi:hypothetical protein
MPGRHFDSEKVRGGEHLPMHLEKLGPTHSPLTPLGSRVDVMAPQDIAHRDLVNPMSQIGQTTLNATVSPGRVVLSHLQDKHFDLFRDTGSPQMVAPGVENVSAYTQPSIPQTHRNSMA